jgi:phosphatidate cytidylyltransferase
MVGVYEYLNLVAEIAPLRWAAYAGAAATTVLPSLIDPVERAVALGVALAIVFGAVAGLILKHRDEVTIRVALSVFGALYLGVPLGFFVATRELPDGAGAIANILVGTWAFDTFSYFTGRAWGTHPIAPRISPNKTVEGFVGGIIGGTLAVWVAGLYMDWIGHVESLILGVVICAFAYAGDLFESMIKRDIGVKDSGRLLGSHGGVLDRFDAMLFTAMAGYFATIWLV